MLTYSIVVFAYESLKSSHLGYHYNGSLYLSLKPKSKTLV